MSLENIGKDYGGSAGTPVLSRLTLNIAAGEFCAITGASGWGKSTLLNIIGLLDRPSSGIYRLAGHDVSRLPAKDAALWRNQAIGFVFQSFHLLSKLTVCDNVALLPIYRAWQGMSVGRLRAPALVTNPDNASSVSGAAAGNCSTEYGATHLGYAANRDRGG